MKLLNSHSIAGFVAGGAICLTACFSIGTDDAERVKKQRPVVPSATVSPEVPAALPFCGKEIDLTRYDRHEGVDRELSSFTYFHSTTMLLIKRANRYFPIIEPILKANHVPDDFIMSEAFILSNFIAPEIIIGSSSFADAKVGTKAKKSNIKRGFIAFML